MKKHQSMNPMINLNKDEQFYKELYNAKKSSSSLKTFLASIDKEDVLKRHLIVPDLFPEFIPYEMTDNDYFQDKNRNVFITKHNRYTPAFIHKHDFFEIIAVFSGSCVQNIGLERKQFKEGDFIFIAPGIFHTMEVFDDSSIIFNILLKKETFYFMFAPMMKGHDLLSEFFSEGMYESQQIKYVIFHTKQEDFIAYQQRMMNLYKEQLYHDDYSDQILIGLLTSQFAYIMREGAETMESSYSSHNEKKHDDFKVMSYIQEHVADVTLEGIADHFGFSTAYCSRLIKSHTGQGFSDWKRIIRIRNAQYMLVNTQMSVREIGNSLGYENPETFIRAFKKQTHTTPAKYRKENISNQ
ncbi:AraC family transcriptional regulator [Kandleria sp.]|uniref:AraC family transcriptional regulator n=1 Tax=Kandleria sp. TaxID=2774291 RepID=UPI001B448ECD|nr:AraC family transcriptional regulator [Kandleria sp.]MBP3275815.1 helix-turn-helix domain-containing protein [Kandleria sp.]